MITSFQAIILGLIQGVSELFPVSSLGHSVILPALFGWNIHQNDNSFLTFLVATHFATALVLVGFFWKDWVHIVKGLWRIVRTGKIDRNDTYSRLGMLLIIGTIPAGILGLILEKPLRSLFASPVSAAVFLIFNAAVLYFAERLRTRAPKNTDEKESDERLSKSLGWKSALSIGTAQALALIPGFSRSGSSMAGGLLAGLSNEDAARFSFLLATPIIGAAALLKLPDLFKAENHDLRMPALLGAIAAGVAAYFAVRFLVRFFQTKQLTPFALYCLLAGVSFMLILIGIQ